KEALEARFPKARLSWIRTESEFCQRLDDFATNPPNIFLLDVMVKWTDPNAKMPAPPKEVVEEKYYRSGLRCRTRLLENPATKRVPVILYTVLERGDIEKVMERLPSHTFFVGKSGEFDDLTTNIANLVGHFQS